jgi:hypothetical protein
MGELIGVNKLREFVQSLILTGRLKCSQPVSAMIIAEPERGKTSIVVEKQCEALAIMTDVTGKGLQILCQMNPRTTHIVINDMGIVGGHSPKTQNYFYAMLMAMTEEGIRSVANPDGVEATKAGRRGFIGCITTTQATDKRHAWHKRGLARRIVPFHFDYSEALVLKIKGEIDKDKSANFESINSFKIPEAPIQVEIDEKFSNEIRKLADVRAEKLRQLGISLLKNYRSLAKGHALLRTWKNPHVNENDVEFLKRIDPYIDWETAAIL